jgi:hypothetical protein
LTPAQAGKVAGPQAENGDRPAAQRPLTATGDQDGVVAGHGASAKRNGGQCQDTLEHRSS